MTTIDDERNIDAAQKLLMLSVQLSGFDSEELQEKRLAALGDVGTLLGRVDQHNDVLRLRGVLAELEGNTTQAIEFLYAAMRAGDVSALIRLEALLRQLGRFGEADQINQRINEEMDLGNGDLLWALIRDWGLRRGSPEGKDGVQLVAEADEQARLLARAVAAGNPHARTFQALQNIDLGAPDALDQLRTNAAFPDAAARLGRHLARFGLGAVQDGDEDESERLLRWAHEQGCLDATIWLWLATEAPDDAEFEAVLDAHLLGGERARHFGHALIGGEGRAIGHAADQALEAGDELAALRLLQVSALAGNDDAIARLGSLLQREADGQGPWAVLGVFLSQWPQSIRWDAVGSPESPLQVLDRQPALRDDHSAALEIESSDFARRIREVLEQRGWTVFELGDHLLVGQWRIESGSIQVYIEITGGIESDRFAHISTPLLVGLPRDRVPPWAAPPEPTVELEGVEDLFDEDIRVSIADVDAFSDAYVHPQRRVIEALFRIGEDDSRDAYLEPMGFLGLTLGGMMGRRMTFDGAPARLYPQAWASSTLSDYISSELIHEAPQIHACEAPIDVMYLGYTLSSELSGGHLRGVVLGAIHSLLIMQDYVAQLFDSQPAVFNELFRAVPMMRIQDHVDLFDGRIPRLGSLPDEPDVAVSTGTDPMQRLRGIIADPGSDALDINNAAWTLMQQGFLDDAMIGLDRAASMGQPNALATLLWHHLLAGRPEQAIVAYEDYFPRTDHWMASADPDISELVFPQLANCLSNAGIAYAALGMFTEALELWDEAAADGHIEAIAYPGVLAARQGDWRSAKRLFKQLSRSEKAAFRSDMESVIAEGSGWFSAWARDALNTLERT